MKANRFWPLLLMLLTCIIILPSLFMNWSLVDDGVLIQKSQQLSVLISSGQIQPLGNLFLEKDIGRFRPSYYLFYWLVFLIGKTHVFTYYFFHFIVFVSLVVTIKKICQILFDEAVGLWAIFFFTASYLNVEHWYRLGPQEPLQLVFLVLSFYLFIRVLLKKGGESYKAGSLIFLVLGFLTKESSVAYGLLIVLTCFLVKTVKMSKIKTGKWNFPFFRTYFWVNLLLTVGLGILSLFLKQAGSYSHGYFFDVQIAGRLLTYLKVLSGSFVPVFPFLVIISVFKYSRKSLWYSFFLFWFIFFLIIQLPWNFVLSRYLMPATFGLSIIMGISMEEFTDYLKKKRVLKKILVIFIVIIFLFQNMFRNFDNILWSLSNSNNAVRFFSSIALLAKPNSTVYFNMEENNSTAELFFESGLHLNLFLNRPEIKTAYLKDIRSLKKDDLIVSALISENLLKYANSSLICNPNLVVLKKVEPVYYTVKDYSLMGLVRQLKSRESSEGPLIKRNTSEWFLYQYQ